MILRLFADRLAWQSNVYVAAGFHVHTKQAKSGDTLFYGL